MITRTQKKKHNQKDEERKKAKNPHVSDNLFRARLVRLTVPPQMSSSSCLFVFFFGGVSASKERRSSPGVRTCGSATPASRKNDLFRKSPLWFLSCCASREILLLVERPVNRASSKIKTRKKKKLVLTAQRESNQRFQRALLPPTSGRPPLLVPSRW